MNYKGRSLEEEIVQRFPNRCPYCDHVVSYEGLDLRYGDNEIRCPFCQRVYIKFVSEK